MSRFFGPSLKSSASSSSARASSASLWMLSIPRPPTTNTRDGSSPSCTTRRSYSSAATKCRCAILVMACRMASSNAPSVVSPPCRCASGMRAMSAADATDRISKRSPSTTTRSGWSRRNVSAKPISPSPMDLVTPPGVSELSNISTFSSIGNPSASISRNVRPNSGDRCMPVATTCSCRPGVSRIAVINQRSRPYSARPPVTTHTLRVMARVTRQYESRDSRAGP